MLNGTQFARQYENDFQKTVRFLIARGLDEEEAREGAQAAWFRGWERREQVRNVENVLPWINSIAINLFRKQWRRSSRMTPLTDGREGSSVSPVAGLVSGLDAERALGKCEPEVRTMLEQYHFMGFLMQEVADAHHCTEVAVRVRLHRARRRLRDELAS